jgi:hypothetical protein
MSGQEEISTIDLFGFEFCVADRPDAAAGARRQRKSKPFPN